MGEKVLCDLQSFMEGITISGRSTHRLSLRASGRHVKSEGAVLPGVRCVEFRCFMTRKGERRGEKRQRKRKGWGRGRIQTPDLAVPLTPRPWASSSLLWTQFPQLSSLKETEDSFQCHRHPVKSRIFSTLLGLLDHTALELSPRLRQQEDQSSGQFSAWMREPVGQWRSLLGLPLPRASLVEKVPAVEVGLIHRDPSHHG